jgi:hypothetical protein
MGNPVHVTYYAEHKEDDLSSWASPRPRFDMEKFQAELTRRCGQGHGVSLSKFRIRWAGEHQEYLLDEYDAHIGWQWTENGEQKYASCAEKDTAIPDGVLVAPVYDRKASYVPRFVIEEWRDGWYHKAWFVEVEKFIGEENGRIDVMSHYREPSELDLKRAEHLNYLRQHLTDEEIGEGLAQLETQRLAAQNTEKAERAEQYDEDFARLMMDGPTERKQFSVGGDFNIKEHSKEVVTAFDSRH